MTDETKDRMGKVVHNLNVGETLTKNQVEELQEIYDEMFDTDASLMKESFDETNTDLVQETIDVIEELLRAIDESHGLGIHHRIVNLTIRLLNPLLHKLRGD